MQAVTNAVRSRRRGAVQVLLTGGTKAGNLAAARVIARDLERRLFRMDLSALVSKYIGETEKNLGRILAEAEQKDIVLFFDEADALFGKRSETRDAHDRYSNETADYLLDRLEAAPAPVIFATRLSRQNVDQAFTRRLRFLVDLAPSLR